MKTKMNVLVSAIALAFSCSALAAEPVAYETESGVNIIPVIATGYKYDDNIFSQGKDTQSSGIFTLAPAVSFLVGDGVNTFQVDFGVESGTFIDSEDDDYVTGNLGYKGHFEASSSARFDLNVGVNLGVEPRGTGITEGTGDAVDEPVTYEEQEAELNYEYGSASSKASIALDGRFYSKSYTNFQEFTRVRSFDASSLTGTFFYSTNSRTDAFVELKSETIGYDANGLVSRDSDVFSALVGVKWEATALTSGSIKVGQQEKSFDNAMREDFSGVSWDALVQWQPLTYTTLSFNTSRNAKDPNVVGDYINESLYGVNWVHQWDEKISTTLGFNFTNEDYSGITREDETTMLTANVAYEIRRWVDMSLYINTTNKESTNDAIVFDKSIVGLNFTFSL